MESVQEHKYMTGLYYDQDQKVIAIGNDIEDAYTSDESTSSSFEDSNISKESSSDDDLIDDAYSSSSSPASNGALYGLSELMDQLPIKRGLSKFYQGKSQSFTSLERVESLQDLAKKETPQQRRLKACKSYAGGLNNFRSYAQPKATISKKAFKTGYLSNLSCLNRKNSFIGSCVPSLSTVRVPSNVC